MRVVRVWSAVKQESHRWKLACAIQGTTKNANCQALGEARSTPMATILPARCLARFPSVSGVLQGTTFAGILTCAANSKILFPTTN